MSKYITATLNVPSEYHEGQSTDQQVKISDPRRNEGKCCGRVQGSNSFYDSGCTNPAKHLHEGVTVKVVDSTLRGKDGHVQEFTTTVGFCGTHDPIRKAEKKLAKRIKERTAHQAEEASKARLTASNEMLVAEINELAGQTLVRVGYNRDYRHTTVELVGGGAHQLKALLEQLVK